MSESKLYVDYTNTVKVDSKRTKRTNRYKSIIEKYRPLSNTDILDIGCGTGRLAVHLGELVNHWYGIDINPEAIETAKKILKS